MLFFLIQMCLKKTRKKQSEKRGGIKVIWYCSFCGRYHTGLTKAYDFSGWRRKGKDKSKDNLCGKGLLFISLLKDSMELKIDSKKSSESIKEACENITNHLRQL